MKNYVLVIILILVLSLSVCGIKPVDTFVNAHKYTDKDGSTKYNCFSMSTGQNYGSLDPANPSLCVCNKGMRADNWDIQIFYKNEIGTSCAYINCGSYGSFDSSSGECKCTTGVQDQYGHKCLGPGVNVACYGNYDKCLAEISYNQKKDPSYAQRVASVNSCMPSCPYNATINQRDETCLKKCFITNNIPDCEGDFHACSRGASTTKTEEKTNTSSLCSNGVLDASNNEVSVDCDGNCASCNWETTLSPKEVEMAANGETSIEFTFSITANKYPIQGQKVDFIINDDLNAVPDELEGDLNRITAVTDSSGKATVTYKTEKQEKEFNGATIQVQASNEHGNPKSIIHLTKEEDICGDWVCTETETVKSCYEDCASDIDVTKMDLVILDNYKKIKLNPSLPTLTYLPISGPINNLLYGDNEYACGAFQGSVLAMLDGLRFNKNATIRKGMELYDYGPIETLFGLHQAVVLYLKDSDWYSTGKVLDPWFQNKHSIFNIANWRALTGGESKPSTSRQDYGDDAYPIFGKPYRNPQGYALTSDEITFRNSLSNDIKEKLKTVSDITLKHFIRTQMIKQESKQKIKIIVASPLNIIITDEKTGKKIGIDSDKKNVQTDKTFKGAILKNSETDSHYIKIFEVPAGATYNLTLNGYSDGKAHILKSFPQSNTKEAVYYDSGEFSVNAKTVVSSVLTELEKDTSFNIDGKTVKPEMTKIAKDDKDYTLDTFNALIDYTQKPKCVCPENKKPDCKETKEVKYTENKCNCVKTECVKEGFFQKLFNFFKKMFAKDSKQKLSVNDTSKKESKTLDCNVTGKWTYKNNELIFFLDNTVLYNKARGTWKNTGLNEIKLEFNSKETDNFFFSNSCNEITDSQNVKLGEKNAVKNLNCDPSGNWVWFDKNSVFIFSDNTAFNNNKEKDYWTIKDQNTITLKWDSKWTDTLSFSKDCTELKGTSQDGNTITAKKSDFKQILRCDPDGVWTWFDGSKILIFGTGTAFNNNNMPDTWRKIDENTIELTWDSKWIDTLSFSEDCLTLSGKNQDNNTVTAKRKSKVDCGELKKKYIELTSVKDDYKSSKDYIFNLNKVAQGEIKILDSCVP